MRATQTSTRPPRSVWLLELGIEPYDTILELQRQLARSRQRGDISDGLIILEHEPVITLGRRADESHVLATRELLEQARIGVHRVERGGDVTYHGPGQIIGYPILRLADYRLGASDYMHRLEEVVIRVLADLGLVGTRRERTIGVWLGNNKVAAFGARIGKGVTYHGFALNVCPNLEHYGLIIPCGITDGGVTSVEHELGRAVDISQVRQLVCNWFSELFHVSSQAVSRAQLEQLATAEMSVGERLPLTGVR